jgi:hypothetical protein
LIRGSRKKKVSVDLLLCRNGGKKKGETKEDIIGTSLSVSLPKAGGSFSSLNPLSHFP